MNESINIPKDSAFVMTSNVIGQQVVRRLALLGFKPTRLHPKRNIRIPRKARLVVVVPKGVSHGASDAALKWHRTSKDDRTLILSNSANEVEEKLLSMGIVEEPLKDVSPWDHKKGIGYARALVSADPGVTVDRWERLIEYHGLDGQTGYSKSQFWKAGNEYRTKNSLPKRRSGSAGGRRPALPVNHAEGKESVDIPVAVKEILEAGAVIDAKGAVAPYKEKVAPTETD
mgnify:CR=1 FL=1